MQSNKKSSSTAVPESSLLSTVSSGNAFLVWSPLSTIILDFSAVSADRCGVISCSLTSSPTEHRQMIRPQSVLGVSSTKVLPFLVDVLLLPN